jgi:hypothetical protein
MHPSRRSAGLLALALASACATSPKGAPAGNAPAALSITDGASLIRAMNDRYAGKWYHTFTFVQHNTQITRSGGAEHSTWLEAGLLPGRLRIDFGETRSGDGILFARDSQYVFQHDSLVQRIAYIHPLLVLGFDVYAQPVERTLDQLRALKFDLSRVHEDQWQGRPAYVVGAAAGDLKSRQFWIDRDRLVFVRMIQPGARDTTRTGETRFNDYRPAGGGWISAQVEFLTDGTRTFLEEYSQIRQDVALDSALFAPNTWKSATFWTPAP